MKQNTIVDLHHELLMHHGPQQIFYWANLMSEITKGLIDQLICSEFASLCCDVDPTTITYHCHYRFHPLQYIESITPDFL